jgi:hypothetical protein
MLNKNTGELLGEEAVGVAARTLHSNWSSPAFGKVGNQEQIIFGAGDGVEPPSVVVMGPVLSKKTVA